MLYLVLLCTLFCPATARHSVPVHAQVFDIMSARGFAPTATTYTALISAHAKADRLDHALATFRRMVGHPDAAPISTAENPDPSSWSCFASLKRSTKLRSNK